jgi:ubiquinone/menaquinone biosynthesis C-methylase UbiE
MSATSDSTKTSSAIKDRYAEFYAERNPDQVYPVEFVVRTFLGTYPNLKLDRSAYRGAKILDLGFGDGRNMPLLHDLGFQVHGIEISEGICNLTSARMEKLGVNVHLKCGSNSHIPFKNEVFDFLLACHSCYYVSPNESFIDNLREIARVLKKGGRFVFSLAKTDSYILNDALPLGDGHYRISGDPYHLRNGTVFRAFASRDEIVREFQMNFADLVLGLCENDYYGLYEKVWIGTCVKVS